MKHHSRFQYGIISILLTLILPSCQRSETQQLSNCSLFSEMLCFAERITQSYHSIALTKSGGINDIDLDSIPIDIAEIDDKYLNYVDRYTHDDELASWDESSIINQINQDYRLSESEKQMIVQGIAYSYVAKNEYEEFCAAQTISPEEICLREFQKAMRRAARTAAIAYFASFFEPSLAGETITTIYLYNAISDAEEDYEDCMRDIPVNEDSEGPGNGNDDLYEDIDD
ncbi:MAG: hypothetical protein MJY83_04690 [Bacteroidales bacterium]|nr:hypothetical protein [Bacteroidales bacterium]